MFNYTENLVKFSNEFKEKYQKELESEGISILSNFENNLELIKQFREKYIIPNKPKIVLCGINPGRYGAGLTGIPFIDFNSLACLLPNIQENKSEKSASFIFSIIKEIGIIEFFKTFYLTNLSCLGFTKNNKNYNYDQLNTEAQNVLFAFFCNEMKEIEPSAIIPLSEQVEKDLYKMQFKSLLSYDIKILKHLPHPSYITTFKRKYEEDFKIEYNERLSQAKTV